MITIKLKIQNQPQIDNYLKQYNNIVHVAFNKLKIGLTQSNTEKFIKSTMNNIDLMDSSFIKAATDSAKGLDINKKIIFGGKKNWTDYNKGLITKEQYQKNKLKPLMVRGSTLDSKGNRKFQLDMNNHQVIFKPNRNVKINISLPKTKLDNVLIKLQKLCELKETYFTCAISEDYIYITYDEKILKDKKYLPIKKRILSIDLNPNYIAYVIKDEKNIYFKEIIGLQELNKCKNTNKKKHEDYEICKRIVEKAKHYRCSHLVYEKLSIGSSDKGKGKLFNKICNSWRRNKIVNNLVKRCNIVGIETQEIIAQYSSFIGQVDNENEYDSIAAAIELGRRGLLYISKYYYKENINIQGKIINIDKKLSKNLVDRWKKKLNFDGNLDNYKSLYDVIKSKRYSYRTFFQFDWFSLRLKSSKSLIYVYS